jgi:ATP-dependent DNA helicase DinG
VIDEAHHFEEVALDSLSKRFDRLNLVRLLGRLYSELHPERSRFMAIRLALKEARSTLISRLEIDLPAEKRGLIEKIERAFYGLEAYCRTTFSTKELKWRFSSQQFEDPFLVQEVKPCFEEVTVGLKRFIASLEALKEEIEKSLPSHAAELQMIAQRLEEQREGLEGFFVKEEANTRVRWVEVNPSGSNLTLVDAELDVSAYLKNELFDPLSTVSLCSATLACAGKFDHLRASLGIGNEDRFSEKIYDSPFDYGSNALLGIPTDLPEPGDPRFLQPATDLIFQALEVSRGGAFLLFTSYEMLQAFYMKLQARLEEGKFHILRQGEAARQHLIERFKREKKSVLFGTDSFWEGVDIAGSGLRLVIIAKLPFRVPTDPLTQAFSEFLTSSGKNAFMDYQVPQAIIKFKQGFGRLIRTQKDRGAILCLDKRLLTKSYGKLFLETLPACKRAIGGNQEILKAIGGMMSEEGQ